MGETVTNQKRTEARKMLEKLSGESEKVYIINLIRHSLQPIDNKALIEGKNRGIKTGCETISSSHLCLFYGLFIPYMGKICALFKGFIPLEKMT